MKRVDIGKLECSFYEQFLKVEGHVRTKNGNSLKSQQKQGRGLQKHQQIQNHRKKQQNYKNTRAHTSIPATKRPSGKNIIRHAHTQLRLARTHRTHNTHETKPKTETDLLVVGEGQAVPTPLNLRCSKKCFGKM